MSWTQILATLALAFTIASVMVGRHLRGGSILWLGWLTGATTVGALWAWWH